MKMPPRAMTRYDLVQWAYEHDFGWYSGEIFDSNPFMFIVPKDLFEMDVYDAIWDEVNANSSEYAEYILEEE